MPSVNDLKEFNRFILAFWLSDLGPVDVSHRTTCSRNTLLLYLHITADMQNAQMWMGMSESDRQTVLDQYHAAGIALMVSAFGSTGE